MDRIPYERSWLEERVLTRVDTVPPSKKASIVKSLSEAVSQPKAELTDEVEDLRRQIRELRATLSTRNNNVNRSHWPPST